MERTVDNELQAYIARLNADQKESLLGVIRSFMPKGKEGDIAGYTREELALFYERRKNFADEPDAVYTIEESHARIRQNRAGK